MMRQNVLICNTLTPAGVRHHPKRAVDRIAKLRRNAVRSVTIDAVQT